MIPFVGGSNELRRKKADTQRTVNMFPSLIESGSGKSDKFLKSIPGLRRFDLTPVVPVSYLYYTSTIYPLLAEDALAVGIAAIQSASQFIMNPDAMNHPVVALQSGTLEATISYLSYLNHRDVNPDTMNHPVVALQSGTLVVTISYVEYLNKRDVNPDEMNHPVTSLQSGTLVVTISYLSYLNKRDVNPDTMNHPVVSLQSGTLV